jgi:lipoate-protein ligase B
VVNFIDIGLKPYNEALAFQKELHARRAAGEIPDTVIFCEHPPVFTVGKRDSSADFLSSMRAIAEEGIEVVKVERGGRITYHGPGQLVVYFIISLSECRLGVKEFVRKIEETCMLALSRFGIDAVRDEEYPGLWAKSPRSPLCKREDKGGNLKKIVAIGLQISKNISMHGAAVNVSPDMAHYRHIIPCGIKERGVTSMKEILGKAPTVKDVAGAMGSGLTI